MIEQQEQLNESPSENIDTALDNESTKETGVIESKEIAVAGVLPHSPLGTVRIDPNKPIDSPVPAHFANFAMSPYPQTPGNRHPPEFSPLPSSWPQPPPLYANPYPPYHSSYGEYPRSSGAGSGDHVQSAKTTEKEGKAPHPYQPYPAPRGYYPYHHGPYYPPKSPGAPPQSSFPAYPLSYNPTAAPYPYAPYLPPNEALEKEQQNHSDEKKRDRLIMSNDSTLDSPIESKSHPNRPLNATDEVKIRRERKNALSRSRAQRQREQAERIRAKPEWERTEEEARLLHQFDTLRDRKNDRSRERATQIKKEVDNILQKPEKERTAKEVQFLKTHLNRKSRKNEGDRMRRERMKALGLASNSKAPHIRVTARGMLPVELDSGRPALENDHPPPYGYSHSPAFSGYSHYPGPLQYYPSFNVRGGTSFTIANGKATTNASFS